MSDAEKRAAELIESGSMALDRRARELVRHRGRIGHAFAFWFCADYCATKHGATIRVFHAPLCNSRADKCRLVATVTDIGAQAYGAICEAIERDCANRAPRAA